MGDDLTELILQYLTFEDKVRLECVSKQWRRLVFNKQFVIELLDKRQVQIENTEKCLSNGLQFNGQSIESVLKKCPNISEVIINFGIDSSVLSLIGRYCNRIKSLTYHDEMPTTIRNNHTLSFFRMYGHKLEELCLYRKNSPISKEFLQFCPNLKNIWLLDNYILMDDNKEFLPKLEKIKSKFATFSVQEGPGDYIGVDQVNEMKILSDKYSQTMKTLNVELSMITKEELKTCIEYIARFENLKELSLNLGFIYDFEPIDDCLSLIGQKCNKLLKLDSSINNVPISEILLDIFSEFKAIQKLKIQLPSDTVLSGSVECFKHCKQLKHLDINYRELREDFFANIASFVPKLQLLNIRTKNNFSDSFINLFQTLKNIQNVNLRLNNGEVMNWYFGKSLIEVMLSPNGVNVKHINDNCGLITKNEGSLFNLNEMLSCLPNSNNNYFSDESYDDDDDFDSEDFGDLIANDDIE